MVCILIATAYTKLLSRVHCFDKARVKKRVTQEGYDVLPMISHVVYSHVCIHVFVRRVAKSIRQFHPRKSTNLHNAHPHVCTNPWMYVKLFRERLAARKIKDACLLISFKITHTHIHTCCIYDAGTLALTKRHSLARCRLRLLLWSSMARLRAIFGYK
jgi:hypothetical protein